MMLRTAFRHSEEPEYTREQMEQALRVVAREQVMKHVTPEKAFKMRGEIDKALDEFFKYMPWTNLRDRFEKLQGGKDTLVVSDEDVKTISTGGSDVGRKLFKSAEGRKGIDGLEGQLLQEAQLLGLSPEMAGMLTKDVLGRLGGTESPDAGQKLGVAHDPNKQYQHIVDALRGRKYD